MCRSLHGGVDIGEGVQDAFTPACYILASTWKSIKPHVFHIQLGLLLFLFKPKPYSPLLEDIFEYSTDSNYTILAGMLSSVACMWFVCGSECRAV